jgi:uncharacterized membrane protein SirB2
LIDPTWYPALRTIHIGAALSSGALFAARGIAMWCGSRLGMQRVVRYTSYGIDSTLLCAAVALAWLTHRAPFADRWLTLKIGMVVLYIVLGSLALKRAPTMTWRRSAFLAALVVFTAVYALARFRQYVIL